MTNKIRKVAAIAGLVAILMFSFSFALSPLYRIVCKKTGLNGGVNVAEVKEQYDGKAIHIGQPILVQFIATNNANLPWQFYPEKSSVRVYPEETTKVMFIVKNNSKHAMTVQAIPSFAPPASAQYFHKIECFCFTQQTLAAGETRAMPVVFRIDKELPSDIQTIALAYTLFDVTKKKDFSMKVKKQRTTKRYFLPHPSHWPLIGSCGLFFLLTGIINIIHGNWYGHYLFMGGALLVTYMMFGWFSTVIDESLGGLYSQQMDRSYRWGMAWFIVSEVAFFGIFFGALFYVREFALPMLGGTIRGPATHTILWPQFKAMWPLLKNPNPTQFPGPAEVVATWGIPAINTLLLLSSAVAITWAHWGLTKNRRWQLNLGLIITIVLGLLFLTGQAFEYTEAYTHFGLTLYSGIYGTTFFMLTGFHAAHVTIGLTMLTVIFIRSLKGHFEPKHHFAFEAVSWYWHFVDVVWLFLFVLVYWL